MIRKIIAAMIASIALGAAAPAAADIYAYRDENGVLNFTNIQPDRDRYDVKVVQKEKRVAASAGKSFTRGSAVRAMRLPPELEPIVNETAETYQVDKALVRAIIHAESAFNPNAISPKGARGLMQLMPATAQRYGVRDIFDPQDNIRGGVKYMRDLLKMFGDNLSLAVAAYNAGENAVLRHGGIPPYPETVNYVNKVLKLHTSYSNI